jgi:hypothetical protein
MIWSTAKSTKIKNLLAISMPPYFSRWFKEIPLEQEPKN